MGDVVKAAEDGYINIAFDNGYNGFCIRYGKDDAKTGDSFTISNMELAINNNTGENISEHLKILFVKYFDTFFQVDTTTNSCMLNEAIAMQHTVWAFSDDFSGWRVDQDIVTDVKQTVATQTMSIPDHGYTMKINNTTQAVFDFHIVKSHKGDVQQNFWTYKVTLVPYPAPKITSPTEAQCIDIKKGETADLTVTAENADTYQWQVDTGDGNGFVNIENATNTSYTTPLTDENNVNYKYRCVATNSAGSTTSLEFSLKLIEDPVGGDPSDGQGNTTPTPSNPSATPDSTLNTNSNATGNSTPKTGDLNYMGLYIAMMFLSLGVLIGTFYKKSKQQ